MSQPETKKPVIVLETMAKLGMSDRYTPAGFQSSVHTIKGDYVYSLDSSLPKPHILQQTALNEFAELALEQLRDFDLVAAVKIEFGKEYVHKSGEEPTPNSWDTRFDYVDSEGVKKYRHSHVRFCQLAIDYRVTADLFREIKRK